MAEIEYNPTPKSLNGSEFSQLSLFNVKPEPQHQWPRGYSPERMHAVAQHIPAEDIETYTHGELPSESPYLSSKKFFTPSEENPHRGKWSRSAHEVKQVQREHTAR